MSLRLISATSLAALGGVALGGFAATTLVQTKAGEVSVQTNPSTQLRSKRADVLEIIRPTEDADLVLAPLAGSLSCTVAELQRVTCQRGGLGFECSAICHQSADNPKQPKPATAPEPIAEPLGGDVP